MKKLFITLIFILCGLNIFNPYRCYSQRSPYHLFIESGASSYTHSAPYGVVIQVDTTDEIHPITFVARTGFFINERGNPNAYWTVQLGACYNYNKHLSIGAFPWYTIAYIPKTNFRVPMAIFFQYHKTRRLNLRLEAAYFWGENNRSGVQATLNYKII